MKLSTAKFFLFISILVLLLTSCSSKLKEGYHSFHDKKYSYITDSLLVVNQKNSFRFSFKVGEIDLSGIAVIKTDGSTVRGSIINEFGIKAFDFISSKDNCKLLNVISFMNKWYITKTIADDFQFLWQINNQNSKNYRFIQIDNEWIIEKISCKKIRKQLIINNDCITLKNKKRNIVYTFTKIEK